MRNVLFIWDGFVIRGHVKTYFDQWNVGKGLWTGSPKAVPTMLSFTVTIKIQGWTKSVNYKVDDHFDVWGIWYSRWSSHCMGNDMQLDEMVCSAVFVLYKHERHRNKICLYNGKAYENSFKPSSGWLWWFLKRHYITNKWKFSEILSVPTREMDRFWEMCMDCGQRATCVWGFWGYYYSFLQ